LECTFGVHDCVLLNCWRVQDCTPSETPEKFEKGVSRLVLQ
jgi:hypothetical protein